MNDHLEILLALHDQVERLELRDVMSPTERQLQNAILVILNVLIEDRRDKLPSALRCAQCGEAWNPMHLCRAVDALGQRAETEKS